MSTNVETNPVAVDTALADALGRQARLAGRANYDREMRELAGKTDPTATELELVAVTGEVATLNAQYNGWSRFFLVQNNGGHIHSSMNCSTCFPSTMFAWLPTVSGKNGSGRGC